MDIVTYTTHFTSSRSKRNDGTVNQPDFLAPWKAFGANLETNKIPNPPNVDLKGQKF